MGRLTLTEPPYTEDSKLYEWMLQIHKLLSGLGTDMTGNLDADNISSLSGFNSDDISEGATNLYITGKTTDNLEEGTTNLYFNGKTTDDLPEGITNLYVTEATASVNASASTVSIASADADAAYSANEVTLINELKTDVNQLVTDVNAIVTSLNELKANLRTAGLLAT